VETTARFLYLSALIVAMSSLASLAAPSFLTSVTSFVRAQTPSVQSASLTPSLQGEWTLNQGAANQPQSRGGSDQGSGGGGVGRASGRGGGGGHGGVGGQGGFGAAGLGLSSSGNPDVTARLQEAMHDITTPPARLTIVQTDTTIIVTTSEGHTTRLAPTGKNIKEENTGIDRKTRWDAGKLVSEISGPGFDKITETYWLDPDPETHRLHVSVTIPSIARAEPTTLDRVYDAPTAK
jgi:hypothetical protein